MNASAVYTTVRTPEMALSEAFDSLWVERASRPRSWGLGMTLGYRTVLSTDATRENLDAIVGAFRKWALGRKGFPFLPDNGTVDNEQGAQLTATTSDRHAEFASMRWTLVEEWAPPHWYRNTDTPRIGVTTVTLAFARGELWLWVDVEPPLLVYPDRSGHEVQEVQPSGRPAFVKTILESVVMRDGIGEPTATFQILATPAHVDELAGVLEDVTRIGAVLVAAAPGNTDVTEWAVEMDRRVGQMQGMAMGFALTGEAREYFNRRYGQSGHWVPPGGMRTFVPGARLHDPEDAREHRLLHPGTLLDADERRIARIIRRAQLRRLDRTRIPAVLRDVDYEFIRRDRMRVFDAPEMDATKTDAEMLDSLRDQLLRAEAVTIEAFEAQYDLETQVGELQLDIDELAGELDDYYQKLNSAIADRAKLRAQVEYLQRKLEELGGEGAEAAWSFKEEPEPRYPETFAALLDRIGELDGVRFTGDIGDALELDEHPELGSTIVMKTWDALTTIDAYVAARKRGEFDHSFSQYVTHADHGHPMRMPRVVWTEGETVTTQRKLRKQRILPVDVRVDPSGFIFMDAHVRLSNLTGVAPRMYFEDTYSVVEYVTIGYLGSHLDSKSTN